MFHARHISAGVTSFSGTVYSYQEVCQNWHFEALMFGLDEADLWRGLGCLVGEHSDWIKAVSEDCDSVISGWSL